MEPFGISSKMEIKIVFMRFVKQYIFFNDLSDAKVEAHAILGNKS